MKKFVSLVLAVCMVMSMGVMAYAEDADPVAEVQAALDAAGPNTTIQLEENVDYGTLYIRPVLGNAHTESGNWYEPNYATELVRKVENLTIIGAAGATVDAIEIVYGYKGSSYIDGARDLWCYADIKNLVIDSVEFTDDLTANGWGYNAPIFIDLASVNVDGLTVKNCKLVGDNDDLNLVYITGHQNTSGGWTFNTAAKNITITDNTVSGIARLCELREADNVTISGNIVENVNEQAVLLASNTGEAYTGDIEISGNEITNTGDRALRVSNVGAGATVVVESNTIVNGTDEANEVLKFSSVAESATITAKGLPEGTYIVIDTASEEKEEIFLTGDFANLKMNSEEEIISGAFAEEPDEEYLAENANITELRTGENDDSDHSEPTPAEIERDRVVAAIKSAEDGETVVLDVKDTSVVSRFIADAMSGKNVNLEYALGEETVTVNGKSVPKTPAYRVWYSLELFKQFA